MDLTTQHGLKMLDTKQLDKKELLDRVVSLRNTADKNKAA